MRILTLFLSIVLLILLSIVLISDSRAILLPTPPTPPRAPDRVIVKFKDSVNTEAQENLFKKLNVARKEKHRLKGTFVANIQKNKVNDYLKLFSQSSLIEYVEPDFIATKVETPNDSLFTSQWGLTKIQASNAWDVTHGVSSSYIAILDTGIDQNHPDVGTKVVKRANFTSDPDVDGDGHGTHVAGIASSITNNALGIAGVGYNSGLYSVKVLDNNGSGYYSWIANGIIWSADNGARVINLSLGGSSSSTTLSNAINYAFGKGVVIVAASGNNNSSRRFYPAYYSNTIAIAASDQNDKKASFSNYGSWVELAAPGVSILSTTNSAYESWSGTSMATPFVAGLAALVASHNPSWSNSTIRSKIEQTADKISGTGTYWTYGRINACKALDCTPSTLLTPTPTSTPTPTPTLTPTPTSTPSPSPSPTATPTPTPTPTLEITPTPTPTPSSKPWWCRYIPTHSTCL